MAAIISIAVGFVGAAVGTAIGAAIGGTILGISAATIGAVIGAGIAGGLLSMARGGDFGKGFLVGAVGAGIGSFASSVFGGAGGAAEGLAEGATAAADGTTSASMLAAQGGAEFAPEALAAATGDIGQAAATSGIETAAVDQGLNATVSGMGDTAASASPSLAETASGSMTPTPEPTAGLEGNMAAPTNAGFTGAEAGLPTPQGGGLQSLWDAGSQNTPSSFGSSSGGLEGAAAPQASGMSFDAGTGASVPTEGGFSLEGTMNKSDAWLGENLGMPKGSTGKLAMGGLDALMKNYQANKLERQVNKMKPLTFEEFKAQHGNPNDYRVASGNMARAGRTGTLPVLLARMNENLRGKYAGYLPGAQQTNLENQAAVSNMKQGAWGAAVRPLASLDWGKA